MDPSRAHGKLVAVVLHQYEADKRTESATFSGIASWDGKSLKVDRGGEGPSLPIPDDALERLAETDERKKKILGGAEYWIWLTVRSFPKGEDKSGYLNLEMKWPKDE